MKNRIFHTAICASTKLPDFGKGMVINMISRAEMKQRAKDAMKTATIHPILMFFAFIGIMIGIQTVIGVVTYIMEIVCFVPLAIGGSTENIPMILGSIAVLFLFVIVLSVAANIPVCCITTGYMHYNLKVIRGQITDIKDLFGFFRKWWKTFCLHFVINLFVALWCLLIEIPVYIIMIIVMIANKGFVDNEIALVIIMPIVILLILIPVMMISLRYAMAVYIYIDYPDKRIMECISDSKKMMKGHKWELFMLQMSFILWFLGLMCTCGLLSIYVTPYMSLTNAIFYDNLTYVTGMHAQIPQNNR